jgi:large subunit ribosomal protein L23
MKKTAKKAAPARTAKATARTAPNMLGKERLMNVLIAPHVSEKSARVSETGNQFVFRVRNDATRSHVKQAVELMFDVKVDDVNVVNQRGKSRRFGQIQGQRSGFKKAYVRLAAGQTIDLGGVKA